LYQKNIAKALTALPAYLDGRAFFFSVFLLKNNVVIFYLQLIFFQLNGEALTNSIEKENISE